MKPRPLTTTAFPFATVIELSRRMRILEHNSASAEARHGRREDWFGALLDANIELREQLRIQQLALDVIMATDSEKQKKKLSKPDWKKVKALLKKTAQRSKKKKR